MFSGIWLPLTAPFPIAQMAPIICSILSLRLPYLKIFCSFPCCLCQQVCSTFLLFVDHMLSVHAELIRLETLTKYELRSTFGFFSTSTSLPSAIFFFTISSLISITASAVGTAGSGGLFICDEIYGSLHGRGSANGLRKCRVLIWMFKCLNIHCRSPCQRKELFKRVGWIPYEMMWRYMHAFMDNLNRDHR